MTEVALGAFTEFLTQRDAVAVLALFALAALWFTRRIPMQQPGRDPTPAPA